MWIEELQRNLTGDQLAIWLGHDLDGKPVAMAQEEQEKYRQVWRAQSAIAGKSFRGQRQNKSGCGCKKATS